LVFAVVDRSNGQGTMWAALTALAFTVAIALWPSRASSFTFATVGAVTVFTTPFMDEQVLPDEVSTARFRQANVAMTAAWAAAAAAGAVSFLLAVELRADAAATVFNWIVPGALVAFTVKATVSRWEADFDPDGRYGGLDGLLGALDAVAGFDDPAWAIRPAEASGPAQSTD